MTNREISNAEMKQIMLEIMDEIHEFCVSNHITYYLIGGTLLGSVRHQGFIPWDDDMDIGLLRQDYEWLLQNFKSKSGNVEIRHSGNMKKYIWSSAKAIHNKTSLIELGYKKSEIGVFIDIFPLDYIDADYEGAKGIIRQSMRWKNLLTLKYLRIDHNRSLLKNMIVMAGKVLYLLPDKLLIKKINSFGKSDYTGTEKYICNFSGVWGLKELTKAENFSKAIYGKFEGREYYIPQGYDDYLHTVYGDYMTPPPVEKRVTHHSNHAYWKD